MALGNEMSGLQHQGAQFVGRELRFLLAGFVALLLAYVGSRFVVEVLLTRSA